MKISPSIYFYALLLSISHVASANISEERASSTNQDAINSDGNVSIIGNDEACYRNHESSAIRARNITIKDNNNILFENNMGDFRGTAIYATGALTLKNNNCVNIVHNNDSSNLNSTQGAIFSEGALVISHNSVFNFSNNTVRTGGTLEARSSVTIDNNGIVQFSNNSAGETVSSSSGHGGAIRHQGSLRISNNSEVIFSDNALKAWASAEGGAISNMWTSSATLSITNNGNISFSRNSAYSSSGRFNASGGAIYTICTLEIMGNNDVLFEKNYERVVDAYRLRSIYSAKYTSSPIYLSAPDNKKITFYDSVYSCGLMHLNQKYTDASGTQRQASGDIIFSGLYTEDHLNEILVANNANRTATDAEILASRTSEVYAMTKLYGGRLRIEDGAIYKGYGITVTEGANATLLLKDGELSHAGYDITISSGSTLSATGENTISASTLAIQNGGTMHLALDMSQVDSSAILTTTGNLSMASISLNLTGTEYLETGDYKLLTRTEGTNYDISGWTLNGATSDQLRWENGTLYYTGGHDWNHAVTDDDDISDLEEILGNLVVNGGDITLEDVVQAIQDAVDAGFGHGKGHIVINRGGIHISGAGDLDGHIIFNGDLKDIRKLFIEKDITSIKIELGGSSEAENIVDVGDEYTIEVDELSGDGGMSKTGQGEMVVHGNGHKVGGTVAVQEGALTFTVGNQTAGDEKPNRTEVHELVVGNNDNREARIQVNEGAQVVGDKLYVNGKHAVVTNDGSMEFTEEVRVKDGRLNNNGSISRVTLEGGKVTGSGSFAGLQMFGGELVVGNSPGLQTYTDDVALTEGMVTFSLADAGTAATADTHGWSAAAYSTIDMSGNALTIGADIHFVLEIGGAALEALTATSDGTLTFSLNLIQNIASESLTLNSEALAELLSNTSIIITSDAEGLTSSTLFLTGRDITSMLSDAGYYYEGNTLVFKGSITNDGSLTIPEPTTATLSLFTLAALAARRRRQK